MCPVWVLKILFQRWCERYFVKTNKQLNATGITGKTSSNRLKWRNINSLSYLIYIITYSYLAQGVTGSERTSKRMASLSRWYSNPNFKLNLIHSPVKSFFFCTEIIYWGVLDQIISFEEWYHHRQEYRLIYSVTSLKSKTLSLLDT